ncbi:MAG: sigma-54-dependent transcriptional regulator [Thermodesulfobacteriota bacterium]
MAKILIIDDDAQLCETMQSLTARLNHECHSALTLHQGLQSLMAENFDLVFLDVRLPDGNGLDVLQDIKGAPSHPEVVILTGQGDPDGAELAIQRGVWDYLIKPSPIKQTKLTLTRALKYREEKENKSGVVALHLENVIGRSPKIKSCFDLIAQGAPSDSNVLITGETGTGKELFARTFHQNSPRAQGPFVVVDCAALTESLVESTLFGHKKGAFTGAQEDRDGLIKLAHRGTLFLDEIGELPLSIQKSFLRVLQERRFRPVGETKEIQSDFRLIAATNKDLNALVEAGDFRQDLLFRLKTMHLDLPPLRERPEDIKPLAMYFLDKLCEDHKLPTKGYDADFFATLAAYGWPGNVRELFNVLEQAFVAAGQEQTLYAMHLPQEIRIKVTKASLRQNNTTQQPHPSEKTVHTVPDNQSNGTYEHLFPSPLPPLKEFRALIERRYLEHLIRITEADIKEILEISGLSRSHFYAMIKKHGITM